MDDLDIDVLCVTCLMEGQSYYSIYDRHILDNSLIYEIINDVCQLDITVDYESAQFICSECCTKLLEFNSFKRESHKARAAHLHMKNNSQKAYIKQEEIFEEMNMLNVSEERCSESENKIEMDIEEVTDDFICKVEDVFCVSDENNVEALQQVYDSCHPHNEEVESKSMTHNPRSRKREGKIAKERESKKPSLKINVCKEKSCSVKQLRVRSQEKQIDCQYCGKRFYYNSQLVEHLKIHTGERPFECNVCGKSFPYKFNLVQHMKTHAKEKHYGCEKCGRRFTYKFNLVKHWKVHTKEKRFECHVCGSRFTHKGDAVRHLKIHIGENPSECQTCGKKLTINVEHVRFHPGEKPFECEICGKKFYTKRHVAQHFRIHTQERPFECQICKKKFYTKANVVHHLRIHTGEKPFECQICGRRFSVKCNLVSHLRIHTEKLSSGS